MRKFIGLMLLLGLFSLAAVAQENYSKAEVFGGYQYTRFDGGVNANGFNGAITGNLNHWFGVAADFSGAYKNVSGVDTKTYTYTFGPQVAMRRGGAFTPFAHALFGGFPAISVRLLQFDWLSLHANGNSDNNNMRLSTGVVFHF